VGAWHGDRVVLRDAAATRAVAGGTVLDPNAPVRYRRTPQRLAELDALEQPQPTQRLHALLTCAPQGLDLRAFAAAQGLPGPEPLLAAVPEGALLQQDSQGVAALGPAQRQQLSDTVSAALAQFHSSHPEELGPDAARLRRLACPRLPDGLWRALLADLQARGVLNVRGAFVHLPAHGVRLSAADERIAQKAGPRLDAAGFEGAWARDLARDCGESEPLMRTTLARLAQRGELHQVVKDLYYPPTTMAQLAALARSVAAQGDGAAVTAAAFRDATGLGRKRAIQVLEYLDRIGLFRRVGDVHRLRADSHLFLSEAH
jgi:selenocysteine-specific elongation factor